MRILAMCAHQFDLNTHDMNQMNKHTPKKPTRTIIKSKTKRTINYPIAHHQGNCMHRRHSSLLDCTQRWKIKWNWHDASHHRWVMPTINYPKDKLCTPTERSDPSNGYTKEKVFLSFAMPQLKKKTIKKQTNTIYTNIVHIYYRWFSDKHFC